MDASSSFPAPMPKLPEPGHLVRWRCCRHAKAIGWADAYGFGPFVVLRVVDRSQDGIPQGLVLQTLRGESEINEVWLVEEPEGARGEGKWPSYRQDILDALHA